MTGAEAPFVLTLEMDGESFAALDALRRRFHPPERNLVPAHVTLFHQLPDERAREIKLFLKQISEKRTPLDLEVSEIKETERGVAVFLRSAQLHALREALAAEWEPWLIPQDRAGFRPHVTLQNNVSAAEARQTQRAAAAAFRRSSIRGVGLHLWRYRGGPWDDVQLFRFR